MTSEDCLTKIEEYEKIKQQIKGLDGYISDCQEVIKTGNTYAKETIINNKPIDNEIFTKLEKKIEEIPEKLQRIINECNSKIENYQELYDRLFIQETKKLAREQKEELNQ